MSVVINETALPYRHLVTGGAGFIGSHLVEALLAAGHDVTIYDNLSAIGRGGWTAPPDLPGLRFVKADLLDINALDAAMKGQEFVWHLGANTDIPAGVRDTRLDLDNCVIATHNVLEAMRRSDVNRLAFTSTGAVYGEIEKTPYSEEAGPLQPISFYAAGKLANEAFISAFCHLFRLQAWCFRFGNVIGARMGHGAIHDFIHKLRENPEELEVLGDGEQEKNYFLVEDCIDGMRYVITHTHQPCDIFNLSADSTTKVKDIARIVIEEMGLKARIRFTGGDRGWPGDQPRVYMDTSKVKALGWRPRHTATEAVRIAVRRLLGKED